MKEAPCLEKKCSECCNPVKVYRLFPKDRIPKDENGKEIWKPIGLAALEGNPDMRVEAYECENYDKESGLCREYDKRPEICKNTSCLDENSDLPADEQHKKFVKDKFILIKR